MAKPSIWRVLRQPVVIAALAFTALLLVLPVVLFYWLSQVFAPVARPDVVNEPDYIGRPYNIDCDDATGSCSMVLEGDRVTIGPDAISLMGEPRHDNLLVLGVDGGLTWYASFSQDWQPPGAPLACNWVLARDMWDAGDSIVFAFPAPDEHEVDFGFRLPKAASWRLGYLADEDGRYSAADYFWCLDRDGAVLSVYPG